MIRVTLPKFILGISFQRAYEFIEEKERVIGGHVEIKHRRLRATFCELHRMAADTRDEGGKLVKGKPEFLLQRTRVRCASNDKFTLEKGRKEALRRALNLLSTTALLTREDRTEIWHTYHGRPRKVSKQKVEEAIQVIDLDNTSPARLTLADATGFSGEGEQRTGEETL